MKCRSNVILFFLILIFYSCNGYSYNTRTSSTDLWDLKDLFKPPSMKWLTHEGPVYSLIYHGLPYHGKETSVFAYYATPGSISGNPLLDRNLPGVILIHGGMGHAAPEWAMIWAKFGFAALSMDLSGCGQDYKPLPNSLPNNDYLDFDYNYHMVANVILAHSLLLGFKEINTNQTAVTGISVGGQLTWIVASIDNRYKAAVPVYGCGYLYENSLFSEKLSIMAKAQREKWIKYFDPSSYIKNIMIPVLFITGTNDQFYPLDSCMKSIRLKKGIINLCIDPAIEHSMQYGMNLMEPYIFIKEYCRGGEPLQLIEKPIITKDCVKARLNFKIKPLKGKLYYTTDKSLFSERKWFSKEAKISGSTIIGQKPPLNTTAWLLSVEDIRHATTSSEVIFK